MEDYRDFEVGFMVYLFLVVVFAIIELAIMAVIVSLSGGEMLIDGVVIEHVFGIGYICATILTIYHIIEEKLKKRK